MLKLEEMNCSLQNYQGKSPMYHGGSKVISKGMRRFWCACLLFSALFCLVHMNLAAVFDKSEDAFLSDSKFQDDFSVDLGQKKHILKSQHGIKIPNVPFITPHTTLEEFLKPLLLEVAAFAIFQGFSPLLSKAFFIASTARASKVPNLLRFFSSLRKKQPVSFGISRPAWLNLKGLERCKQSFQKMYRQRSRLSAASDYTHVLGDNIDEQKNH
mmetsp:Transcript_8805/g.12769  ORF Transcript_8805/g.12769 Transcript_8805/m.12769 type:complete len:213 (-) Transcript_8805:88-726(-)